MSRALWLADFEFRWDRLRVRQTGAEVPYTLSVGKEVVDWFAFYAFVAGARVYNGVRLRRGARIAFAPAPPRPWYLLWAVARLAGARFTAPERADYVFYFEDATVGGAVPPEGPARPVNFGCQDVSKSRVAEVFERVFGYSLAVDPATWTGAAVEKSELNGAHDGRVVDCPRPAREGYVYQRVIANTDDGVMVEDLRCPTVAGEIPAVFIKRRPVDDRFANYNCEVRLRRPEDVLSEDERLKLAAFAREMGLEWGGLDVLRDRRDQRIYVVDVNKTDMGPPTALPLADKARAALRLARAFDRSFPPQD